MSTEENEKPKVWCSGEIQALIQYIGYNGMVLHQMGGPIQKMNSFGNAVQMLLQKQLFRLNVQVRECTFKFFTYRRNTCERR